MIHQRKPAHDHRGDYRNQDVGDQAPPFARQILLALDEEVVHLALQVLDPLLHQTGDFRLHHGHTGVDGGAELLCGVVHQLDHVVLGELALAVQFGGNLVQLVIDFPARVQYRLAQFAAGLLHPILDNAIQLLRSLFDGRAGNLFQAFPCVIHFLFEPSHSHTSYFLKNSAYGGGPSPGSVLPIAPSLPESRLWILLLCRHIRSSDSAATAATSTPDCNHSQP